MPTNPDKVLSQGIVRQKTGKKGKFSKMDMINAVKDHSAPLSMDEKKEIIDTASSKIDIIIKVQARIRGYNVRNKQRKMTMQTTL